VTSVLIVDDQNTSRIILEELLGALDPALRVHSFGSPHAALEWAAANQPDLVLTDYRMPEMDGVEFIQRLRELPSCADVPVVVITVVDDRVVRYQALEAGATDILTKPIDHHECRARCQNLLTLRRQSQLIKNRARWLERQVGDSTRLLRLRERQALQVAAHVAEYRIDPGGEGTTRVAWIARLIAARLGLGETECDGVELAAMLHDVGMVAVPETVALKPGTLSAEEFETVKEHCRAGHALLAEHPSPHLQIAAEVALAHHERVDGRGYPHGLAGEAIPLAARITAVADVYDALTSLRVYRPAMTMDKAIEFLNRNKGVVFDPQCLEAFNAQLDRVAAYEHGHRRLQDVD